MKPVHNPEKWMHGWRFALVCALLFASVLLQCMVSGCSGGPNPNAVDKQIPYSTVSEGGAAIIEVDAGAQYLWCYYHGQVLVDCDWESSP